mmetsp:Transcript_58104/g.92333  ORF Transcript_58104/g.92333 Transcript_58104/m.92333 type:complete len:367 (-) Transcript_58104:51-1151(-)
MVSSTPEESDLQNPPPSCAPTHRPHPRNQVLVNIYEIAGFGRMNRLMASAEVPIGGAVHAGVEVYGNEWSYGGGHARGSGVTRDVPRQNRQHRFSETIVMPATSLTSEEVKEVVADLLSLWPATEYHWLRRNCLTFANELCERLGVGKMPAWIDRFARGASALDHGFSLIAEGAMGVAEGARFIMNMMYGAGDCGQCTKMPALRTEGSAPMGMVEQLSATHQRQSKSSAFSRTRRLSPQPTLKTGAFALPDLKSERRDDVGQERRPRVPPVRLHEATAFRGSPSLLPQAYEQDSSVPLAGRRVSHEEGDLMEPPSPCLSFDMTPVHLPGRGAAPPTMRSNLAAAFETVNTLEESVRCPPHPTGVSD